MNYADKINLFEQMRQAEIDEQNNPTESPEREDACSRFIKFYDEILGEHLLIQYRAWKRWTIEKQRKGYA